MVEVFTYDTSFVIMSLKALYGEFEYYYVKVHVNV